MINQLAVENFSAALDSSSVLISNDIDATVQSFNEHCTLLLDRVAPFKTLQTPIVNTSLWINDAICSFRRVCRKTEHLWKATQLQVHRLHLKELLSDINEMIKDARASYFMMPSAALDVFVERLSVYGKRLSSKSIACILRALVRYK